MREISSSDDGAPDSGTGDARLFYVYPFETIEGEIAHEYDRYFLERWCEEGLAALMAHPNRTDHPEEADFFVVSWSLACVSFLTTRYRDLRKKLARMPWRHAGPHVVFDLTDRPKPAFNSPDLIVLKSAFHEDYYSPKNGVPIPQFPRFRFDHDVLPASERPLLAGFKGHLRSDFTQLREALLELDQESEIAFVPGRVTPETFTFPESGEPYESDRDLETSHTWLIHNSKFALLPRANGYALSYRMLESMNAGAIPVVLSDGYVLPFRELISYEDFALQIPESDAPQLIDVLMSHEDQLDARQARSLKIFERYFSSTEKIVHSALDICLQRVGAETFRSNTISRLLERHIGY